MYKANSRFRRFVQLGLFVLLSFLSLRCLGSTETREALSPTAGATTPPPSPTHTAQPTPTARPTTTPLPTQTPTPLPTLGPEDKLQFAVEMLETNGGCELPCWWGITPGETGWEEMRASFTARGIGVGQGGYLDLSYFDPEQGQRVGTLNVTFRQEDGLVQGVSVTGEYHDLLVQEDFIPAWQRYTLAQVLSRHGAPDQVYLRLATRSGDYSPGLVPTYDLWIVYDDLGMAIRYPGELIRDNQGWLVCPVFGTVKGIEIQIQSPGAGAPATGVESGDWGFGVAGTLAELTGTGVEDFHGAFSRFPPQTCLLVPDHDPWWYDEVELPPGPALLPEEEDGLVVDMLANNGGCELPCWWGITPGVTSWQEARQTFLSYGKSVSSRETEFGIEHGIGLFGRHSPYPFDYVIEHRLYERDDTVRLIGVMGHTLGWSTPDHFDRDWQRYSLDQVLARFGVPSRVLLHYWMQGWRYSIAVVYDDRGILVHYVGQIPGDELEYSADPVIICPTQNRPTGINVWLAAPGSDVSLEEAFAGSGYGYPFPHRFFSTPSLEDATGMGPGAFHETYLDPDTQVCLEVRRELGEPVP